MRVARSAVSRSRTRNVGADDAGGSILQGVPAPNHEEERMSFVLFIVLLIITWELNAIRLNTQSHLTDAQVRERRNRLLWGRDR